MNAGERSLVSCPDFSATSTTCVSVMQCNFSANERNRYRVVQYNFKATNTTGVDPSAEIGLSLSVDVWRQAMMTSELYAKRKVCRQAMVLDIHISSDKMCRHAMTSTFLCAAVFSSRGFG